MNSALFTIGHSNHPDEHFLWLLRQHGISAVGDVRSHPYSRVHPQFNRERLKTILRQSGIEYVFMGSELGARSSDQNCYENGQVSYEKLAKTESFVRAMERIIDGAKRHRIALMCAEKDPITCHRMVLICHHIRNLPLDIAHILADGSLEKNEHAEERLLEATGVSSSDLFLSRDQLIEEAYGRQAQRIAWRMPESLSEGHSAMFAEVESES